MIKPSDRPALHEVPVPAGPQRGRVYLTINEGAWDALIKAGYESGFTLIEMDEDERPVRAFRMQPGQ